MLNSVNGRERRLYSVGNVSLTRNSLDPLQMCTSSTDSQSKSNQSEMVALASLVYHQPRGISEELPPRQPHSALTDKIISD